jgi:DNA repair protein RadA/Sms
MAKSTTAYVCQDCGASSALWAGKCPGCGAWNTLVEEVTGERGPGKQVSGGKVVALQSLNAQVPDPPRISTGIIELDRVIGGGLVPGSAILVGGDPGIGKSTLLLQAAAELSNAGHAAVYFSGEEAVAQVRLRAERLGVSSSPVGLAAETGLAHILKTLSECEKTPDLVIIDSIQTLWSDQLESAPGTVSQVRACAQALVRLVKRSGSTLVLVGHVTKEGQIAGPKVIEHMVDTVLYFEGDGAHQYRILRAVKNRFGPSDEIGVFEMRGDGLREVANPSELFLGERDSASPGAAVFAGMEGTRPILVEIQALVAPSPLGTPRRAVVGWDSSRLAMVLAVLDTRCGLQLGTHDVYLNVAGGLKITDPAADLAAAAALVSSFSGVALPASNIYFGEVSLSGAIRAVGHMAARLKEAEKLGFTGAAVPAKLGPDAEGSALQLDSVAHLSELTAKLAPEQDNPEK